MFCKHCGNKIPENSKFCGKCGKAVNSEGSEKARVGKQNIELTDAQKKFIKGRSWGALSGFLWAIFSRAYWYIIIFFIPYLNFLAVIYFIFMGRTLVWGLGKWDDFESFKQRQETIDKWTKIIFIPLMIIALLGILSSIAVVGLGPAQKDGRDARRGADLRQVQVALELYYNKNSVYPPDTSWSALTYDLKTSGIGIAEVPNDPVAGKSYGYAANHAGTSYVVGAQLENPSKPSMKNGFVGYTFPSSRETFILSDGLGTCSTTGVYCVSF